MFFNKTKKKYNIISTSNEGLRAGLKSNNNNQKKSPICSLIFNDLMKVCVLSDLVIYQTSTY